MANYFSPETSPESTTKNTKRPTISDIARAAGVSIAVVSYALNGKPGVSPATRDRVLRIANEYGWRPSAAARSLRTSPKTVGLAMIEGDSSATHSTHFIEFLAGVQESLAVEQLSLMVHLVGSAEQAADLLRMWWAERRFDGFLLTDVQIDDPRITTVAKNNIPSVSIAHPEATHGTPYVWVSEEEAYVSTVRMLHGLGHMHIALMNGAANLDIGARRAQAARVESARLGVRLTIMEAHSAEVAAANTRLLLASTDRPTALIYDNDSHAVTGIDVARRLSLAVPWDLSIVGFGTSAASQLSMPSLTTVHYPYREIGKTAGQALIKVIAGGQQSFDRIVLESATVRGTTAPAPS